MQIITTKKFDKHFKKQSKKIKQSFAEKIVIFMEDKYTTPVSYTHLTLPTIYSV